MTQTRRILCLAGSLIIAAACDRSPSKAFDRGVAAFRDQNFSRAATCFEQAVHAGTPTAQAWNFLGVSRLQNGNAPDAIKAFQACLELDPGHAPARYNLAVAYLENNQPDQAVAPLKQLTQSPQCPPSAYYQLGRALLATGAWSPARQAFAQLNDADTNPELQNNLGIIETRLGNFKSARAHFETAAALPAATLNLAVLEHHYLGQKTAAAQHYQKYLDQLPHPEQRDDLRLLIAQLTQDSPKPIEPPAALKPIEPPPAPLPTPKPVAAEDLPALEPKPSTPPPAPPRPTVKRRTPVTVPPLKAGDRTKARAAFNDGIREQQQGKLPDAIAAYQRALTLDPTFAQAYYNLAIAHADLHQLDKALADYEHALTADPDFTNARYNYAILLQKQGYLPDALTQYEKFLDKNPNDAAVHLIAASLYARDPQAKPKARQHYQAVHRLTPDSPAGRDAQDWLRRNP